MTDETTARDRAVNLALWQVETWTALPDANGTAKVLAAEVCRLRALPGAPTADVAALLNACDELDRRSRQRVGEIERGERHGPPIWRQLSTDEIRRLLAAPAAAPEGMDAADEQDANRCPDCGKPLRRCCYMCPAGPHDDGCEGVEPEGIDVEAQGEMADELTAAQAEVERLSELVQEHYGVENDQAAELERLRCQLTAAQAAIQRVRAVADRAEHGCLRWADPLPVPEWVGQVRRALDGDTTEEQS